MFSQSLSAVLERIKPVFQRSAPIYLVGGAVRDLLLGKPGNDLDFVVQKNAIQTAKKVANLLNAAFYPLHEDFDAGRVLVHLPIRAEGERFSPDSKQTENVIVLDFSRMRGESLEEDLRLRDFTINAIALDLEKPEQIIDPLHGAADLKAKILRVCSETSFLDDPQRILRAVRFANHLSLTIDNTTRSLMNHSIPFLLNSSPERLRDEVFHILEQDNAARAFRLFAQLGVLARLLPEIQALDHLSQSPPHIYDVWEHTLTTLNKLNAIMAILTPSHPTHREDRSSNNLTLGLVRLKLGCFIEKMLAHFQPIPSQHLSRRGLLFFAALYHDTGKPKHQSIEGNGRIRFFEHEIESERILNQRTGFFHLSHDERNLLKKMVKFHMRPLFLSMNEGTPSRRALYRFFRDTGDAAVDICLLAMADFLATYDYTLSQKAWEHFLEVIYLLLDTYWNHQTTHISPPPLLSGDDLISLFQLDPSPSIGSLLAELREAQAIGQISEREQAIQWVQQLLRSQNEEDG